MISHQLHPKLLPIHTTPRRRYSSGSKTLAVSIGLVTIIALFSLTNAFLIQQLPKFLFLQGLNSTTSFFVSSTLAGICSGLLYLTSNLLEQSRRAKIRNFSAPFIVKNTSNARRCRQLSLSRSLYSRVVKN